MDGRRFLDVARELLQGKDESHWRSALGRAYYALMLEARDALTRWGLPCPPRESPHHFARLRLHLPKDADCKSVAQALDDLSKLRNEADYRIASPGRFANDSEASRAVTRAAMAIAFLDALDVDRPRRDAAVAAIRAVYP
jgi:hypothetical protein